MKQRILKKRLRRQYEVFVFRLFSAQPEWQSISKVTKISHSEWQVLNTKITHSARTIAKLKYKQLFQLVCIAKKLGLVPTMPSYLAANRNHALN